MCWVESCTYFANKHKWSHIVLNAVNLNLIISTLHEFGGHLGKCRCFCTEFYSISRNYLNPSFPDIMFPLSIFDSFLFSLSIKYCYLEEENVFIDHCNVVWDHWYQVPSQITLMVCRIFPGYLWSGGYIYHTQTHDLPDFKSEHEVLQVPKKNVLSILCLPIHQYLIFCGWSWEIIWPYRGWIHFRSFLCIQVAWLHIFSCIGLYR